MSVRLASIVTPSLLSTLSLLACGGGENRSTTQDPGHGSSTGGTSQENMGGETSGSQEPQEVELPTNDDAALSDLTPREFIELCTTTAGTEEFRQAICSYESSVLVRSDAQTQTEYAELCEAETAECVADAASFCETAPLPTKNCESSVGDYRECMEKLFNTWTSLGDCTDGLEGSRGTEDVIPSVVCDPYIAVCLSGR